MRALAGPERALPGEWLTTLEVASLLELSRQRVDQLRRQDLPALRSPHGWLYNRSEVIEWQNSRKDNGKMSTTPPEQEPEPEAKPVPTGVTWAPGLNADQLPIEGTLEFKAEDLSGSNLVQAVTVADNWKARAKAEGQSGDVKYPDEFATAFQGVGDQPASAIVRQEPPPEPLES